MKLAEREAFILEAELNTSSDGGETRATNQSTSNHENEHANVGTDVPGRMRTMLLGVLQYTCHLSVQCS